MEYIALKEICTINMGQSPESSSYNESKYGLPFFQGKADFGEKYPLARMWCSNPIKVANAGDILISVRAPIGALNYAKEDCCIGRGLAAIKVDESRISKEFIYYLLKNKNAELNSMGIGSTFKAIGRKVLEEILVPDIKVEIQKKYAQNLGMLYDIIQKRKQQLDFLNDLVKAQFVEMFGDPEFNTKEWEIFKLEDLCSIGSSKRIYQNEQSTVGIPFLRISDLVNRIDTDSKECELFIPEERYNKLVEEGLVPTVGDILVTSRGTLGKCYIIDENDKFYFQDGMISWLSNFRENITAVYILYLFMMQGFRKQIDNLQSGSTVAYLSISMLKKLNIMIPDIELQEQFATFVQQVDKSKLLCKEYMLTPKVYKAIKSDVEYTQDKTIQFVKAKSRILDYLEQENSITNQKIRELCGFTKQQARAVTDRMRDENILAIEGKGKLSRYVKVDD